MLAKRKKRRDSGTRSRVSKGPLRDREHLARVLQAGVCYACAGHRFVEAHHIRECFPRTMGVRIGDDKVVPLCPYCHARLHQNSRTFWKCPQQMVIEYAAALYAETLSLRSKANTKSSVAALQPRREG